MLSSDFVNVSISSGTLGTEDLLLTFATFLDQNTEAFVVGLITDAFGKNLAKRNPKFAEYILEELFDVLDEIAPEGCSFMSHPGDGANFGFWSNDEEDSQEPSPSDEGRPTLGDDYELVRPLDKTVAWYEKLETSLFATVAVW